MSEMAWTAPVVSAHDGVARPLSRRRDWLLIAISLVLFADSLEAWQLGPIPIQWLSRSAAIAFGALLVMKGRLHFAPGTGWLLLLIAWGLIRTGWIAAFGPTVVMPALATTSFHVFVALRIFNLLAFLAVIQLVFTAIVEGRRERLQATLVTLGAVAAVIAIYFYFAQILGLPQPPRNRVSTGGGEQVLHFSYAFHRALGTFREPSHLAEWLAVPLFLSFGARSRRQYIEGVIMAAALLLTGSLTGIVGTVAGLVVALILTNPFGVEKIRILTRIAIVGAIGMFVFQKVVVTNLPGSIGLFDVLTGRLQPILEGGMSTSNRFYVYAFVENVPITFLGVGLGIANLELGRFLQSDLVVSFLNMFFNTAYALGVPGVVLLAGFLLAPVVRLWTRARHMLQERTVYLSAAAVFTWWVVFFVRADEFSPMFAVAYAFLAAAAVRPQDAGAQRAT